jgi:hypothetical protein
MFDSIANWWHGLWGGDSSGGGGGDQPAAPAPAAPAPAAPAPAAPDTAGGQTADQWRTMTQAACPTVVPINQHPSATDAQVEYMECMAGNPSAYGIDVAPPSPSAQTYGQ